MSIVSFFITLIIQTTLFCRQNVVLARASCWKWGWISGIRHFLKDHKALIYPQILHNHCFQFPLGIKSSSEKSKTTLCIFFRGEGWGKKFATLFYCSFERAASPPTTCYRFHKSLEIHERTDAKNGLLQWYGHSRVLGISISKTRVIQASPSHITLATWVTRVTREGYKGGIWEWGCPYHCDSAFKTVPNCCSTQLWPSPTHNCKIANRDVEYHLLASPILCHQSCPMLDLLDCKKVVFFFVFSFHRFSVA